MTVFCNGVRTSIRRVSNHANNSVHLKRLRIQRRTLHTGLPILRSAQRENLRNDPTQHGILKRRTVPPMSVHRLRAQNHVRAVEKCILQDVLCVHILMPTPKPKKFHGIRNGKNIIRLKGPGATLDIQQRYDGASDRMVPVDDETL